MRPTLLALGLAACTADKPSSGRGEPCSQDAATDADADGYLAFAAGCGDSGQLDCDDANPDIYPGADERCDGLDDDCDGAVDNDALDAATWYADDDADGHGDPDASEQACDQPTGFVYGDDDCDDTDSERWEADDDGACLDTGDTGAPDDTGETPDPASCSDDLVEAITDDGLGWPSVAEAIAEASDGGTVDVCEGTHAEELTIPDGITLTLRSDNGDPTTTLLSGDGTWRILSVGTDAVLTVENLGLVNGYVLYGRAEPTTPEGGGAIHAPEAALTVSGCVFTDNEAGQAGAIQAGGELVIADSSFTGNYGYFFGGAITLQADAGSSVRVEGCSFVDNEAHYTGGALRVDGEGDVEITDSSFAENMASFDAALSLATSWGGSLAVRIEDSSFDSNWSIQTAGVLKAGGWGELSLDIVGCDLTGNVAGTENGVIDFSPWDDATLTIQDTTITGSDASHNGAILIGGYSPSMVVSITGSTIEGNRARYTSSVLQTDGVFDLAQVEIVDSTIASNSGAPALRIGDYTALSCDNVDFGDDGTDNSPSDLVFGDTTYDDLGAGETFECEAEGECTW